MEETVLNALELCALFRGFERNRIPEILRLCKAERQNFSAGDQVLTEKETRRRIGILLEGNLTVFAPGDDLTPLNRLKTGSLFGVSALFGSPGADTRIRAENDGMLLFINEDCAEVLWEDRIIRKNLISFLTDRICFLNRKIAAFTAKGAEGKLARHLSQHADDDGVCKLDTSYSELAKSLHLGRASLYRAMDKLEAEGIIRRDKKVIRILCPESISLSL